MTQLPSFRGSCLRTEGLHGEADVLCTPSLTWTPVATSGYEEIRVDV